MTALNALSEAGRVHRILIVDDDEFDQRLYKRLLTSQGSHSFTIHQVSDGLAGLAALAAQDFDCVLLDLRLSDMTGFDFLGAAANRDGELPCAVVLVTGQGDEATAVKAMKRGAQDYLVKHQLNDENLRRAITGAVTQMDLHQRLAGTMRDLTNTNAALKQEIAIRKTAERELEDSAAALASLADRLQQALDQAERASRAKSRFLAGMSHEMRTPLNGILGYAELLRIEGGLNPSQLARLQAMQDAGTHLLEMIHTVLDLSEIETERVTLHPSEVDLRQLARVCLDLVRPMASNKQLALHISVASDVPTYLRTDPMRLRQLLLNLLGNAVKFTDRGGVELRLRRLAGETGLRFEVADTGPGIKPEQLPFLFQEFSRLDTELTKLTEGAGLGLSLSVRLATLLGGRLYHEPNPGGGSLFCLELPLSVRDAAPPSNVNLSSPTDSPPPLPPPSPASPPPPSPPSPPPSERRLSLLVVDDIEMNREIAAAFLRAAGHEVTCVDSGAGAIAAAAANDFDLVLMDVRMPGMDGLQATRRIREIAGPRGSVPIVALTAQAFTEQVQDCRAAGMDSHLCKPFTPDALLDAVRRAVQSGSSTTRQ
jgi:signal transduction histidine kinase